MSSSQKEPGKNYTYNKMSGLWCKTTDIVWDDLRVPLISAREAAAAPPGLELFAGSSSIYQYAFDAAATESVYFACQLPHNWLEGSEIHPHLHWCPSTTNGGGVSWVLRYTWANINDVFPTETTDSVTASALGRAWEHKIASFLPIDGTGKKVSSMFVARLYRYGGASDDTYPGDAFGLEFDIHYQIDSLGSVEEYTK